jgi:hypothetical protein
MLLKQYISNIENNNNILNAEVENYRKTITEDPDISQ